MEEKNFNRKAFEESIAIFEKEKLDSIYVGVVNEKIHLLKYKGARRSRLVLGIINVMPFTYFKKQIDAIALALDEDESLSETIDVFCSVTVGASNRENMIAIANTRGIALRIFDISEIMSIKTISLLLHPKNEEYRETDIYEKMMFDYLSKANSSSFIKNGFYYSVILFLIYKNGELSKAELREAMDRNLGISNDNLDNSINYLLNSNPGRIKAIKKDNEIVYQLSPDENERIEETDKESKDLEKEFLHQFRIIANDYNVDSDELVYQQFLDFYVKSGSRIIDMDGETKDTKKYYEVFKTFCIKHMQNPEEFANFFKELNVICSGNSFLNRICLAKSFLGLYHSQKYQNYISQRQNNVVLDTALLVHYLCCKFDLSKYGNEEYQDHDFKIIKSLIDYKEQNNSTVKFLVPFDYVGEVVGELRKAFKLSMFDEMSGLAIPFQTSNIFFNYYLFVKKIKKEHGCVSKYGFADFVEELGFDVRECYETSFFTRNIARMKIFFETTGCIFINRIAGRYDNFEALERDYSDFLFRERYYHKSPKAIEADLRQSIYFAKLSNEDEMIDYYISSWDTSLYYLRKIVNKDLFYVKSYSIHRPGALLNRIMLKSFKVNDKCFTNEIFAYADKTYDLSDKIKSMFDNVITPYFSSASNNNSSLVKKVINLQKEYIDDPGEGAKSSREKILPIEEIFVQIIDKIQENACTTRDLSMYLADKGNTDFVVELIGRAINSYKLGKRIDISSELCNSLIQYLAKKDMEYMTNQNLNLKNDNEKK